MSAGGVRQGGRTTKMRVGEHKNQRLNKPEPGPKSVYKVLRGCQVAHRKWAAGFFRDTKWRSYSVSSAHRHSTPWNQTAGAQALGRGAPWGFRRRGRLGPAGRIWPGPSLGRREAYRRCGHVDTLGVATWTHSGGPLGHRAADHLVTSGATSVLQISRVFECS